MAQFYEGMDSELAYQETATGSQWLTIEVSRLVVDIIFREVDQEVRDALMSTLEKLATKDGRIELDAFMEVVVDKFHGFSKQLEEQLVAFYNTAIIRSQYFHLII